MNDITEGEKYFVKDSANNYRKAQIVSIRLVKNQYEYYVHYIGSDKRLDEWIPKENVDRNSKYESPRFTRWQKRKYDEINKESVQGSPNEITKLEKEFQEQTRVRNIDKIQFGDYEIDTWYYSPYQDEYKRVHMLYICELCLKYMKYEITFDTHRSVCPKVRPPGVEIYRNDPLVVYEIDGEIDKLYCQNLCLLSKLFLDHKTVYYNVAPFMFYVLCKINDKSNESDILGYFSKEKVSVEKNNLACILTLPPFQGQGYGKFLISFSYELSKLEGIIGGPEKPLSDLGWRGYLCYWEQVIMNYMCDKLAEATSSLSMSASNNSDTTNNTHLVINLTDISEATYIDPVDIKSALEYGGGKIMKFFDKTENSFFIGRQSLLNMYGKSDQVQSPLKDTQQNQASNMSRRSSNNGAIKVGKQTGNVSECAPASHICVGGVDLRKLKWTPKVKPKNE